jgi:hypothetical protein
MEAWRKAEAVALAHGGRHVDLDKDGLLMEVRLIDVLGRYLSVV